MGAIRFKPRSLVDALDGTDSNGGCSSLKNLIFDPGTPFTMECRPAATQLADSSLGIISVAYGLGTRIYGMAASSTFTGKDEPFCYETLTSSFLTISGVADSLLPTSPASSGAWTPPQMQQIGGRVMLTHPGFPGGSGAYIGWFDISGAAISTTGSTQNTLTTLVNVANASGIAPGMTVTGTGIASNSTVISVTVGAISPVATTGATVSGSATLTNVGTSTGAAAGMAITGSGIPDGTMITAVTAGTGPFNSTGVLASGSNQVTGFAGVANAAVGQAITGTNIPAGTTITAILSQGGVQNFTATEVNGSVTLTNVSNSSLLATGVGVTGSGIPSGTTLSAISANAGPFTTTVNSTSGSPVLTGIANFANFSVGQDIAGPALPDGTTILSISPATTPAVTTGTLSSSTTVTNVADTSGISAGMTVTGTGIASGTTVTSVANPGPTGTQGTVTSVSGTTIGLSSIAGAAVGQLISFYIAPGGIGTLLGGSTITGVNAGAGTVTIANAVSGNAPGRLFLIQGNIVTLSQAATNSASGVSLTFGGAAQVTVSNNANGSLTGTGIVYGGGRATLSAAATAAGTLISLAGTASGIIQISQNATGSGSQTLTFGGASFTLSQNATASAAGVAITFGGSTVELSQPMTATAQGIALTFTGGGSSTPEWGAGNTSGTPLPSVPQAIGLFNGRAYYACGNALYFSDSGFPTQITSATQILVVGDNLPIVALYPLPITTQLQGIIQALIAFKQNLIWQITGDISIGNSVTVTSVANSTTVSTGNLALNTLAVATGTQAPRSIATTPKGVCYMANDGVRIINPDGSVTDPLPDLRLPFIQSVVPSRAAASANGSCYRICTQNGNASGSPNQDFWRDFARQGWTGPHSFIYDCATPFENGFVLVRNDQPGKLYYADYQQQQNSSFTELAATMTFQYDTAPMADSGGATQSWSIISSANIWQLGKPFLINYMATDEKGDTLASCYLASDIVNTLWDAFTWDAGVWASATLALSPSQLPWNNSLTFNRLVISATGPCGFGVRLGPYEIQAEAIGVPQQ